MAEATAAAPPVVTAPESKPKLGDLRATKTEVQVGVQHAAGMENNARRPLTEQQKAIFDQGKAQLEAKQAEISLRTLRSGFSRSEWRNTVNDKIFTGPEDASGNKTAQGGEAAETARLGNFIQTAESYMQKGFDNLTPAEQTTLTANLKDIINNNAVLADALSLRVDATTGKPLVDTVAVQNLLRQEGFQLQVADILNDKLNPEKSDTEKNLDLEMGNNRSRAAEIQKTKTTAEADKKKIEGAPAARKAFDTDFDATTGKTKADTKRDLETGMAATATGNKDIDDGMRGFKNNLDELQRIANQLEKGEGDKNGLIARQTDLQRWVNDAKSYPSPQGDQAQQYEVLYKESQQINTDLARAGEIPQLDAKLAKADAETAVLDREFMKLQTQKDGMSADFAKGIDQVMHEATEEYMEQKVVEYIQSYRDVTSEGALSELGKKYQDVMTEAFNKRWTKEMTKRKLFGEEKVTKLNKEQIKSDFKNLLADGPDALITDLLAGLPDGDREALKQNTEFMNSLKSQAAEKTLAAYIGAGNQVNEEQIRILSLKSYGESAIQNMLAHNKKVKEYIEQAIGGNVFDKGSINKIKDKLGNKGLLSLLAMGIIGTVAGAISVAKGAGEVGITTN